MNKYNLVKAFFNQNNIFWNGNPLETTFLASSKSLLPIVFVAIDKLINDPHLLSTMLSYDLVVNKEGLCFVEAINIDILDEEKLINEVRQAGGTALLSAHFNLIASSDDKKSSYDVSTFCTQVREKFVNYQQEHRLHIESDFDFLTIEKQASNVPDVDVNDHHNQTALDESPLEESMSSQPTSYESITYDTNDHGSNKPKPLLPFALAESYPMMDNIGKNFIEEIAVIATAEYLSQHSDKTIEDLEKEAALELKVTEATILAALIHETAILDKLASNFQCQSYQLIFSEKVYALRSNLFRFSESRSFGDPSSTWYQVAKKCVSKLKLSSYVQHCFANAFTENKMGTGAFVDQLMLSNDDDVSYIEFNNKRTNNLVFRSLSSQGIKRKLSKKVIGQESAINSLCQGYLTSSIDSQQGPRTIYTFVGPSGVGKTFLASQLLCELNEYEKTGYEFNVFNMEHYADSRDGLKLFGTGIQYVDASLGMLTHVVRAQPRQILLFDEIEKAHSTVIQSLLSILDSGLAKDQTSQEVVDFSQCIVIFTTNLGQDIIANNPQNRSISIFDILRSSKNPSSKTQLSPEFVNRLAKGYPIVFSSLKINHLLRLADRELEEKEKPDPQLTFGWPDNFAGFLLKTMAPDISVRGLKGVSAKVQSQILNKATPFFEQFPHDKMVFDVQVDNEEHGQPHSHSKLLLLDNDSRVFELLNRTSMKNDVSLCSDKDKIKSAIEIHLPDALLIDIDTIENSHSSLLYFLSDELDKHSKLPVFTYRIVNEDEQDDSVSLSHDVREHFSIELSKFDHSFPSMIERIQYYLAIEHDLSSMTRRREALSYHCSVTPSEQGFNVLFHRQSVNQVVQTDDLRANDLFKMSLPTIKLDDVIGLERAKKRLIDVISWLKTPEKLSHFGVPIPSGFLFAGPPGTGKTLLAKAVAGESGLPFFAVSASELSSSSSGGTTQNIKKLFATARKYAPSMVFIDEIDAIASRRSDSEQGADRDRNLTVNALLSEMDGFVSGDDAVFVMAATNHPQLLDSAIVRPGRFDETIFCDLPNRHAREQFFTKFSARHNVEFVTADLNDLVASSRGMSSAQIDQVFREAIYQVVGENNPLTVEVIKKTMVRVSYGSPSENIVLSEREKQRTAYHEAGHLLVSSLLFPKQEIDFVTIEPRDQALGFVATRAEEEYEGYSVACILNRLEVLLAGRVAEKLFSAKADEISSGASNDISKATKLAMHAIYEGGLEPSIGPVNVGMLTKYEESELLLNAQTAVQQWIIKAEKSVEQRLTEHRSSLDSVAGKLYEKESLLGEEIEQLLLSLTR